LLDRSAFSTLVAILSDTGKDRMAPFGLPWWTFAAVLVAGGSVLLAVAWAALAFSRRDGRDE
jgi:hypothetical protein